MPTLLLVTLASAVAGCVEDSVGTVRPSGAVAVWEFPSQTPAPIVRLLPADPSSPKRSKRHLGTRKEEGRLGLTVDGTDPFLVWHFEDPVRASVVRVDVECEEPGPLQLFWSTPRCPVFSEPCSASLTLAKGRQLVGFFVDAQDPIRELRLDVTDRLGARLTLYEMGLFDRDAFDGTWTVGDPETRLVSIDTGLEVHAESNDPWLAVATPGLDAAWADTVEVTIRGALGGAPRLYWAGPNGGFDEGRSVRLSPVDAGALTHSARLKDSPAWNGPIGNLRLDPSPTSGTYVVEHMGLVRTAAGNDSK